MIQPVESLPGQGMTLRTLSFSGHDIGAAQRRQLAFQQQTRAAFLNPVLQQQVDQAMAEMDRLQAQGLKAENPNKYTLDYATKGTPWVGDCFGF